MNEEYPTQYRVVSYNPIYFIIFQSIFDKEYNYNFNKNDI